MLLKFIVYSSVLAVAYFQEEPCINPMGIEGVCKSIRDCPHILDELIKHQSNPDYIAYIQNSNAVCNFVVPFVCCDLLEPTSTLPAFKTDSALASRLSEPEQGCGYSDKALKRIVGGEPAVLGGWPWMALLGYKNNLGEIGFKCGASLITSRHLLTAAHCYRSNLVIARLGEYDTSTDTETQHVDVDIVKTIVHPNYDKRDGSSDVAIVYLGQSVQFTDLIKPICLPIAEPLHSKIFDDYQPFVVGWGNTQEGGKPATVLQQLQIKVFPNTECIDRYRAINKLLTEKQFNDAVLCAGVLEGGMDSCQGDSGGPLMYPNLINGVAYFYQIGIVSYGIGCARANVPGVYTRVQSFTDWIQKQIDEPILRFIR